MSTRIKHGLAHFQIVSGARRCLSRQTRRQEERRTDHMFDVLRSDFGFAAGCLVAAHLVAPQSPSRTAMSEDKQTNNTSSGCEPTNTTPRASGQAAASTGTSTGYASSSDHTLPPETAATVLARRIECEQARSRKQWE